MLTIFSTPKPFRGHIDVTQRNALQSWTLLHPEIEVLLFGDEEGAAEVSAEFGLRHEPRVERSPHGAKYLNYLFERAQQLARHDLLCYANCDILLMADFQAAVERVSRWRKNFLMVGQRWDVDITEPCNFEQPDWQSGLRAMALQRGELRATHTVDYFVFPRGLYRNIPPLMIGRIWWDHWLIWKARSQKAAVVDSSPAVVAVHQNHDYSYHPQGTEGVYRGEEARRNYELAAEGRHLCTIEDATHRLSPGGAIRRTPLRKELFVAGNFLWEVLIHRTFPLRKRLGMRRETWRRTFKGDSVSRA